MSWLTRKRRFAESTENSTNPRLLDLRPGVFVFLEVLCDEIGSEAAPMIASLREDHGNLEIAEVLDCEEGVPILRNVNLTVRHPLTVKCSVSRLTLNAVRLGVNGNGQRDPSRVTKTPGEINRGLPPRYRVTPFFEGVYIYLTTTATL